MRVAMRTEWAAAGALACLCACGSTELHPIQSEPAPGDAGAILVDASSAPHADASAQSDAFAGGTPNDGGSRDAGSSDAAAGRCKRGIASNAAPSSAFAPSSSSPGITWWYNWAAQGQGQAAGIEFDPMIWGSGSIHATLPPGSKYVLGFNEPNFKAQANLTATQAAADWSAVQAAAGSVGAGGIVAPGMNFCGSASDPSQCTDPSVTDPYTYLKDFFSACAGCEVDYIAVHWYNCDLPSLRAYIEGNVDAGGGLQGFLQFGKPIWLTEFSCDSSHTVADQKAYMQVAVPYLENNPNVFRYSWFSASGIPNAELANSDGSLTDLGATYVTLPQNCP
jgi:hypothetical protein